MRTWRADKGITRIQVGVSVTLVVLLAFLVIFLVQDKDPQWFQSAFERSVKKSQTIQTMIRDLLASVEAEKSAVMAETDEESQAFAEQSSQASQNVENARHQLEPLLGENGEHIRLFGEFSRCWEKLQEIDREVLALAVQNTNLKALRLSFVPAAETVRGMENALTQLMGMVSASPEAADITRLAAQAVIGALNMYMLHAPHIAESTVTRMDEMEALMQSRDAQVTDAFQSLQTRVSEAGKTLLDTAWASYKDFQNIHTEIVALSRRNSNVRSYALSLGQKRKTTAQCLDVLASLQESVRQSMNYKATR